MKLAGFYRETGQSVKSLTFFALLTQGDFQYIFYYYYHYSPKAFVIQKDSSELGTLFNQVF